MPLRFLVLAACLVTACGQSGRSPAPTKPTPSPLIGLRYPPVPSNSDRTAEKPREQAAPSASRTDRSTPGRSALPNPATTEQSAGAIHQAPERTQPTEASASSTEGSSDESNRGGLLESLFAEDLPSVSARELVAYLDADPGNGAHAGEAEKLERATARATTLVDDALARVKNGHDPHLYPNVLLNLASELRLRITRTTAEFSADLASIRAEGYRETSVRLKRLDAALVDAEGATATTLARLKKEAQDKLAELEDQCEMLDRTVSTLEEKVSRVDRALRLWRDSGTIDASSYRGCEILRDGFIALFRSDRR